MTESEKGKVGEGSVRVRGPIYHEQVLVGLYVLPVTRCKVGRCEMTGQRGTSNTKRSNTKRSNTDSGMGE